MNPQLVDSLIYTALILFIEHWIPMGPRKHHVIVNYVLGVLAIFIGITIYSLKLGRGIALHEVWLFPVVGGAAVVLAYLWDWAMKKLTQDDSNVRTPTTKD